jgi:hypothetical protein
VLSSKTAIVLLHTFRFEIRELIAPTYANPQYRYVRGVVHVSGAAYSWTKLIWNKEFALTFTFIFTRT